MRNAFILLFCLIAAVCGSAKAADAEFGAQLRGMRPPVPAPSQTAGADAPAGQISAALSRADICGADGAALAAAREQRRQKGLKAIEREIRPKFAALVKKYSLPEPDKDDYVNSAMTSISFTRPYAFNIKLAKEALAAFVRVIEDAVLRHVALPDYSKIQSILTAQINMEPCLAAADKAELVRRVKLTKLVKPSQYISDYVMTSGDLWPLIPLATQDQAINVSYKDMGGAENPNIERDQSLIVMYPGLFLSESRGRDASVHIDFILAHETAHSIDSERFPGLYTRYTDCMKTRYRQNFKVWDEVLADYWADAVVAQIIAADPSSDKLAYLRKSYEIICGTTGENDAISNIITTAEHPSGNYRIENVLGGNPEILKNLGFQNAPASACRP